MKVAVRKMKPVTHRLELRRNGNFTIIDDALIQIQLDLRWHLKC